MEYFAFSSLIQNLNNATGIPLSELIFPDANIVVFPSVTSYLTMMLHIASHDNDTLGWCIGTYMYINGFQPLFQKSPSVSYWDYSLKEHRRHITLYYRRTVMVGDGRSFSCFQHHGSLSAGTLQMLRMSWGSSFTPSILSAGHLVFVCGQDRIGGWY